LLDFLRLAGSNCEKDVEQDWPAQNGLLGDKMVLVILRVFVPLYSVFLRPKHGG
jgi:hypothetical protein